MALSMLFAGHTKCKDLAMTALLIMQGAVFGIPVDYRASSSRNPPRATVGLSTVVAMGPSVQHHPVEIPAVSLHVLGEAETKYIPWHYRMLQDETHRLSSHSQLLFSPNDYRAAPHNDMNLGITMMQADLLERAHKKTLLYVGTRNHGRQARDFYITPISIDPSNAEFQDLRAWFLPPNVQDLLGVHSPAMVLISTPMKLTSTAPVDVGVHGHVPLTSADIDTLRSHLEQSDWSRSLSDVISRLRLMKVLPLFPGRPG